MATTQSGLWPSRRAGLEIEAFVWRTYHRISAQFRARRRFGFNELFPAENYRCLLDVGGTVKFWNDYEDRDVTIVNLAEDIGYDDVRVVRADGCNLPYGDASFPLVFSNSTLEHVGVREKQWEFAGELRRVGQTLYCQTPNRWFPFEVHYLCLFVHWWPRLLRNHFVVRYLTGWGWIVRPDRKAVSDYADYVNLLTANEMRAMFPDCELVREKFLGLTKSFIAVRPSAGTSAAKALRAA